MTDFKKNVDASLNSSQNIRKRGLRCTKIQSLTSSSVLTHSSTCALFLSYAEETKSNRLTILILPDWSIALLHTLCWTPAGGRLPNRDVDNLNTSGP